METLSRVPCKQRLSTWTHGRYSLVKKRPVALTYVVSQNAPAGRRTKNEIGRASWEHRAVGRFGHFGTHRTGRPAADRQYQIYLIPPADVVRTSARRTTPGRCHDFWNSHNRCPADAPRRLTMTGRCKIGRPAGRRLSEFPALVVFVDFIFISCT